ncbi:MAG: MFS transporter [Desulfuromonadales bacterium]|nr:MFS transporter [Desulfuromonadales bacterium]
MPQRRYFELIPIILTTVLALSALYAPQPLLPALQLEFGVSREAAAALTTVTFIPLALAPLVYGYLLETVSPLRILKLAVPLLAISALLFAVATSYPQLLAIRLFQGLLIPALLTSLMTWLSARSSAETLQRTMALYITATIFGGFAGRATSGLIANLFGWRFSFVALAFSLFVAFALLIRLKPASGTRFVRPHPQAILEVLRKPDFLPLYLGVFCLFLVFSAVMNFIPFRLTELSDKTDSMRIGLMYSGYMMGIVTSLGAPWFIRQLGGEVRTIRSGLLVLGGTLITFATPLVGVLFASMFLFCGAMFLVHTTASGLVNQMAGNSHRGLTNGLYVAFYYAGGSIGSIAPGILYQQFGWNAFLLLLALICIIGYGCCRRISVTTTIPPRSGDQ